MFTQAHLAAAFGGVLRHVRLGGADLHDDADQRSITVLTDDERPLVLYGERQSQRIVSPDGTSAEGDLPSAKPPAAP